MTGRLLFVLLFTPLLGQAAAVPKVLPGLLIDIQTPDGWNLKAKHLPAKDDNPTFLLLHGTGQRKEDWYYLARALEARGYGYLALDFRGHGESNVGPDGQPASWRKFPATKTNNEFAKMAHDVEAVVAYLAGRGLAENSIGIVGADVGSSIGLKYAAVNPEVPFIVMLSPGLSYQEVLTVNAMRAYKNRPILMVHSAADKYSARATPLLYGFAKLSVGENNATVITVDHEHGTKMLQRNRGLIARIIDWTSAPVKLPEGTGVSSATVNSSTPAPEADGLRPPLNEPAAPSPGAPDHDKEIE